MLSLYFVGTTRAKNKMIKNGQKPDASNKLKKKEKNGKTVCRTLKCTIFALHSLVLVCAPLYTIYNIHIPPFGMICYEPYPRDTKI